MLHDFQFRVQVDFLNLIFSLFLFKFKEREKTLSLKLYRNDITL